MPGSYKGFVNKDCEFFPCHGGETSRFNCLFCFCPLYPYDCGGDFVVLVRKDGSEVKDCSGCMIPHSSGGYDYVMEFLKTQVCS